MRIDRMVVVDLAVGAALLVASLVEIWLVDDAPAGGWGEPQVLATALALAAVAPLPWRARRPLVAAGVVLAATVGSLALVAPEQGPFETFVAVVLVVYSLGAHTPLSVSGPVVGATVAAGVASIALSAQELENMAPAIVWLVGTWALAVVVRERAKRTRELEDVTGQLALEREERAQAAVAVERARIARELHDVVAHNVALMVVHSGAATRTLEGDQPIVRDALATIETVGRQTVDEMRRLLGILRRDEEPALAPPPSLDHLDALVEQARGAGLRVDLALEPDRASVPAGVDLAAYRIVQEALTNALKHAGRACASVSVRYAGDGLQIEVTDDGDGRSDGGGSGNGLVGMRERVGLYGGSFSAGPRPEGGYRVSAHLPCKGGPAP